MRIYLAARYRRLAEMRRSADDLERLGHQVTSRWLRGHHDVPGPLGDPAWPSIGQQDMEDVQAADALIAFTEPQRGEGGGGRHVELGMGLAWGKRLLVVGPREHLFHTLPSIEVYPTWTDALQALSSEG